MGRANIALSADEMMDLLRGATLAIEIESGRIDEGMVYTPVFRTVDLFSLRVVYVLHEPDTDSVLITLSGVGLPEWSPGYVPLTIKHTLTRRFEEPAAHRPRRQFDLELE